MTILRDMAWERARAFTRHDDNCACDECTELQRAFASFPEAVAVEQERARHQWACYCGPLGHSAGCPDNV